MSGYNHETPPMLEDSTYSYVTCPKCGHKINDITPNEFYSHLGEIRKEFYDLRSEFRQALAKKDDEISELRKENVELRQALAKKDDEISELRKENVELRQALAKKDDEISELRKEMVELRDIVMKFCK